jgi:hypothetical protein
MIADCQAGQHVAGSKSTQTAKTHKGPDDLQLIARPFVCFYCASRDDGN